MSGWVDFKELRSRLKFENVLAHYGVEIKSKGEQHMGPCPLPKHGENRKFPSFSANLKRGIFHCFRCHAKGNLLDFAVLMEGVEPGDGRGLRQVAAKLQTKFCPELKAKGGKSTKETEHDGEWEPESAQLDLQDKPVVTNPALDFELKGLDASHPYFADLELTPETVAHFGLGFCARGSLAGRIAIPLHDAAGQLVGYAGCVIGDAVITEENPRYRLPTTRERDGQVLEFKKSLLLYNRHRLAESSKDLIVVEGLESVWWLHQNGLPRVVATMGAECSDEQIALIASLAKPDACVWVMPGADKAGEMFGRVLVPRISQARFVRWAMLPDGRQPIDLSEEELKMCLLA